MGTYQVLAIPVRVDLGAMEIKGYSAFLKDPGLKRHQQTVQCHIQDTRFWSLTSLRRCSWHILQPQPTSFASVLWHINHYKLFNAKSFYTYIKYMTSKHFVNNIFIRVWAFAFFFLLHTLIWFHLFLSKTNSSIYYLSFVCTQLNVFKYCYLTTTIQLNITHLFTHSWMVKQFYFKQFNLALDICFHSI